MAAESRSEDRPPSTLAAWRTPLTFIAPQPLQLAFLHQSLRLLHKRNHASEGGGENLLDELLDRSEVVTQLKGGGADVGAAHLCPGQEQLLEALHLLAVICCSLLDTQAASDRDRTSSRRAGRWELTIRTLSIMS